MPHRRFVIAAIVAAILLLALAAGVAHLRTGRSWDEMQRIASRIEEQQNRADHRREPLWGDGVVEPAFPHYEEALRHEAALRDADREQITALIRAGDSVVPDAASRERWRPMLAALRRGARAIDAGQRLSQPVDPRTGSVDLLPCRCLANAAVLEARALLQQGRGAEAVQWTLDVATFGNDLTLRGTLIQQIVGNTVTAIAIYTAWPTNVLAQLDSGALDLLGDGLASLDSRLPLRATFDADLVLMARSLAQPSGYLEIDGGLAAWRYAFSARWMLADAFHEVRDRMQRLDRASPKWPLREAQLDHEYAAVQRSLNPIARQVTPCMTGVERQFRDTLTGLRLLRIAVDLHRGMSPPTLADPFGDEALVCRQIGSGYRLGSIGERAGKAIEREVRLLVLPKASPK